ncbi:MAG TPA: PIG-L family deacetylase [Thermoanaerobaculia bacterium]|jgi:LmbE family N-acetylglucosaminyl deacetylase|nr:PIG-L family deacetylase [Thermoanaerobaculia bacterium]
MRILWIGAHPDDELFVAPWLARLRTTAGAKIGFLVATRGEQGDCRVSPTGHGDVGSVREAEMRDAAALFDADLAFLGWRDGVAPEPRDVLHAWANDAGGRNQLRAQLRAAIDRFAPDWIVTFDRRHGCSWHADHRALGILVQSLALPIPVTLAQSRITFSEPLRIEPGVPNAEALNVSDTWDVLLHDLASHPSQFPAETIELFRRLPEEQRVIWLLHNPSWSRLRYARDNVAAAALSVKSFIRDRVVNSQ